MGDYETLKRAITSIIKDNGNNEITGQALQSVLLSIVSAISENYMFAGIAEPNTNPGNPEEKVFYIASTPGTYNNFAGIRVDTTAKILKNNSSGWEALDTNLILNTEVEQILSSLITFEYAVSANQTLIPTSWSKNLPIISLGQWLFTKITISTPNSTSSFITKSYYGEGGSTNAKVIPSPRFGRAVYATSVNYGNAGVSIDSETEIYYFANQKIFAACSNLNVLKPTIYPTFAVNTNGATYLDYQDSGVQGAKVHTDRLYQLEGTNSIYMWKDDTSGLVEIASGSSAEGYATTTYVDTAISNAITKTLITPV